MEEIIRKPILVGLFNPYSADPKQALWPDPPGSEGWRLWQLSGMDKEIWIEAFDRINLCDATEWDPVKAKNWSWRKLLPISQSSCALILGHEVREALRLEKHPWLLPKVSRPGTRGGWTYRLLPKPSLRTQIYSDPLFRANVRMLLQELAEQ